MPVQDIDRPDVNGTPPKMLGVCEAVKACLEGLAVPFLSVSTDDNIMSSVWVRGAFTPQSEWTNRIFHNAPYFIISLTPAGGKRYYDPEDGKVTLELTSKGRGVANLRKYTGTVDKAIAKLVEWIKAGAR